MVSACSLTHHQVLLIPFSYFRLLPPSRIAFLPTRHSPLAWSYSEGDRMEQQAKGMSQTTDDIYCCKMHWGSYCSHQDRICHFAPLDALKGVHGAKPPVLEWSIASALYGIVRYGYSKMADMLVLQWCTIGKFLFTFHGRLLSITRNSTYACVRCVFQLFVLIPSSVNTILREAPLNAYQSELCFRSAPPTR